MRFLADEHLPPMMVEALRADGHDVLAARDHFSGFSDVDLVGAALAADRIILTFDADYGELHYHRAMRPFPAVLYVRTRDEPVPVVLEHLLMHLRSGLACTGNFSVIDCATGKARISKLLD